jgi:Tfp pilus assembly protein PilF
VAGSKEHKKAASVKEPSGPHLTKVTSPDGVEAAWKALAAGRLDEAELLYARVLSEQPNHVDALVGLAHVLHRRGQREAALQTYRLALSHAPDNATALSGSLALMSEADPATAESRLKDYIESRPQDDAAHVSLGQTLGRQGRWSEAQASFFKAYTLQPQSAVNAYNLAVSLDHLHQYAQALKFYRAAVAASRQGDIPMESALKRIDVLARELSHEP